MRRTGRPGPLRALLVACWLALAGRLSAQSISGSLLRADSSAAAGVIVVATRGALDSVLVRTITGGSGRYMLELAPGAVRLRALRIGQRPFLIGTFELAAGETRTVRTVLPDQPIVLQTVITTASTTCRKTGQEGVAVAEVFEEARKALLSTQLSSRERRPIARISEYTQLRSLGDRETSPLRRDFFEGESLRPFRSLSPDSLARVGYAQADSTGTVYWAPDADVLLSEVFASAHCLDLTEGKGEQAGWIGLVFRPAKFKRGFVDVSGTLWLDRQTSELRRMEFGFEGLPVAAERARPGGSLEFTRLRDGLWFVSRWEMRMPRLRVQAGGVRLFGVQVKGGDVWRMKRGDDLLFTNGKEEPALAPNVLAAAPSSMAIAAGEATDTLMTVRRCDTASTRTATGLVHGVVHDERGAPLADAVVTAEWQEQHSVVSGQIAWRTQQVTTVAARDGYFAICGVPRRRLMTLSAQYGVRRTGAVAVSIAEQEALARVDLRLVGARAAAPPKGVVVRVRDIAGVAVPYALVEVAGGRGRVTDDSGRVFLSAAPDTVGLVVRRLGYTPYVGKRGRDAKSGEFEVQLPPIAQVLGAVQVTARGNTPLVQRGFYDRVQRTQRGAFNGEFMTPEELDARPTMRVTDLFNGRRFVGLNRTKGVGGKTYLMGRGGCKMTVVLDGVVLRPTSERDGVGYITIVALDDIVDPNSVAAIEMYASAANAPAELIPLVGAAQSGACGIAAIWTGGRR